MALKILGIVILCAFFAAVVLLIISESKRTKTIAAVIVGCILIGLLGYGIGELPKVKEQRFLYDGQSLPVSQLSDMLSKELSSQNVG